ncbi:hypothetical protein Tco_0167794 [Tanacetum coccineum]
MRNASQKANQGVPPAGQSTVSPAEGEKNTNPATKDAETSLHNELVDLWASHLSDTIFNKRHYIGYILEDGNDKVILNFKVSDLHLAEWKEVALKLGPVGLGRHEMVNTRTDAELAAAVQAAVDAMLPQIREQVREEYRAGASGGNPPPATIHTWLERFNKQKPHSFEKAVAPVDAENWISHMEKIFDVM